MGNSSSRKKGKKGQKATAETSTGTTVDAATRKANRTEFEKYVNNMSETELDKLKQLWQYRAKGQQLDRAQFVDFFLQLAPGKNRDQVDMIFNAVDSDGSGHVDLDEFLAFYALNRHGSQEDQLGAIFDALDVDGDGQLSKDELRRRIYQLVTYLYTGGKHPSAEQKTSIETDVNRIIDPVFTALDADKSGGVSKTEFVQGFIKEDVLKAHWDEIRDSIDGSDDE